MSLWLYIYVYMYVCINLFVCLFILKSNAWGKKQTCLFACGNFGHKVSLSVSMNSKFHKHDISISMLFYLLIFLLLIYL